MIRCELIIELLDNCIFSERNATEGSHRGLDYIPGNALLGAAASQLYNKQAEIAFDLFHSGKVSFGNAYPITQTGERTYPSPLNWHEAKEKTATSKDTLLSLTTLDASKVWNHPKYLEHTQPKQLRQGYISATGTYSKIEKNFSMKTAISHKTGRAEEAQLFGYDALVAGQRFYTSINIDDGDDASANMIFELLKSVFNDTIVLGRSRSAEFGRAKVTLLDTKPQALPSTELKEGDKQLTLWLQSDLMALDEFGQLTLNPTSQNLGLPEGKLCLKESFLRTRCYSLWNAYKQGYELERQVINKGSILVYCLDEPLGKTEVVCVKEHIALGLGIERACGLGRVLVNPTLLEGKHPAFDSSAKTLIDNPSKNIARPEHSKLIAWLENKQGEMSTRQKAARSARKIAQVYPELMASARRLQGFDASIHVGPSLSQWGSVEQALKNATPKTSINDILKTINENAEGWSDRLISTEDSPPITFQQWFKLTFEKYPKDHPNTSSGEKPSIRFLQLLVREIMAKINSQKDQKPKSSQEEQA